MRPTVSCLCPTFGRVHLLEEAVESFLRQDYEGPKELIVCNDFDRQELHFSHPEVKVVNCRSRAPNLGAKRNVTASYAKGHYFITWGDDDIHLPGRITRLVNEAESSGSPFVLEGHHIMFDGKAMRKNEFSTGGAHLVYRELYWGLGGIPEANSGEDLQFNDLVKTTLGLTTFTRCTSAPQFIYRWGSDRPHISAVAQRTEDKEACYATFYDLASRLVDRGLEPEGQVTLNPRWSEPWDEMAAAL